MPAEGENKRYSWRFADGDRIFRLLPDRHRLTVDEAELELGRRAFDLLVYCVERAGRALSRKELLDQVWLGITVSPSSISTQVSELRAALGFNCIVAAGQGYQFVPEVERIEVPAPPALRQSAVTLPHLPDPGTGRVAELAALAALCLDRRLTSVVGPGGVGKTWAAVKTGWHLVESFPDGVHFLDLGPAREKLAVAGTLAQALNLALRRGDDPNRLLAERIDRQRMLLIFDSCEYVIEPVRELVRILLALAPNLAILATSQEPLGLPEEEIFLLAPLVPEDAEALFLRRVKAAGLRGPQTGRMAAAVTEICRRLDGIPLALELAAARVPVLGIEGVREGLDHRRFLMLDAKKRNGAARQATLSAMVEWSHGLLDEADRVVFRRLGRFRGSFTHEAAHAVAGLDGNEWDTGACLGRLVEKSLLVAEGSDRPRYRLLETLRFYAEARLDEKGETDATAQRHAEFYTGLFERADDAWETMPDEDWTARYGPEIDNLRVALDWAMAAAKRRGIAIALGGAGAHLWERLNLSAEGRAYMDRLAGLIDETVPIADAARLLNSAGMLWLRTDRARSVALTEQSIILYRQIESGPKLGVALDYIGGNFVFLGRYEEAKATLAEAQALLAGSDRVKSSLRVAIDLATLAQRENRFDDAKSAFQAARDLAQKLKDPLREYIVANNLAVLEFRMGNLARAIEHFRDAASGFRSVAQPAYLGPALVNLAACLTLEGADAEARVQATEALTLTRADGGTWLRLCLERWALLAACAGQYAEAAQLLGFVDAGFVRSGEVRAPLSQRVHEEAMSLLAAHCRAEDIRAWADDAARWSEAQAADFAVRRLTIAGT